MYNVGAGGISVALSELFKPHDYINSIFDIDLAKLRQRGINGLILDLDNTLVQWNHPIPPKGLTDWFRNIKDEGLKACIVSNNSTGRCQAFTETLNIPFVSDAVKPRRGGFRRAMALMGTSSRETAVIGDQVLTDIFGGRRMGLYTILVMPLTPKEFVGTRFVRLFETIWLDYLRRRGYFDNTLSKR